MKGNRELLANKQHYKQQYQEQMDVLKSIGLEQEVCQLFNFMYMCCLICPTTQVPYLATFLTNIRKFLRSSSKYKEGNNRLLPNNQKSYNVILNKCHTTKRTRTTQV